MAVQPTSQVARWYEILFEFTCTCSINHGNSDVLGRRPCTNCDQYRHIQDRDAGPHMDALFTRREEENYSWDQGKLIYRRKPYP